MGYGLEGALPDATATATSRKSYSFRFSGDSSQSSACVACHSLDYIVANSPFMTRQVWDAEVTKMIKAFGAPIEDADAKAIAEYLKKNYGG